MDTGTGPHLRRPALYLHQKNRRFDRSTNLIVIDISEPASPKRSGLGILPDFHDFFEYSYSSGILSYYFIDDYLYWFIINSPNQPVIEIFDLSGSLNRE